MHKLFLSILLLFFTLKSFSQKVDLDKVESISSILCDCLEYNKIKEDSTRIEECSQVLIDGLSVIKEESLKEAYAQKSDTYLQRRCLEYARIIYKNVPVSNIELVDKDVFDNHTRLSLQNVIGKYLYTDFFGEKFNVEITQSSWNEKISSTNFQIKFSFNQIRKSLIYEESNHPFFVDFYSKGEEIEIRHKFTPDGKLSIVLNLGNDIYLKKLLTKI